MKLPEEPKFIKSYRALRNDKTTELNAALDYIDNLKSIIAEQQEIISELTDQQANPC